MTFTVSSTDCSANVVAGTYKVNNKPVFFEWTDAAQSVHKKKLRDKVEGTLDMFFRSLTDYNAFLTTLESATSDGKTALTVSVNNTNSNKTGNFYVDMEPARNIDGSWSDYMEKFTLNISEV